jgi:S-adenosylmethionine/arginine decarboxylase-like enzyme
MEVYTGKSQPARNLVLELLGAQLLNKVYHLYQDNYYNSVKLSEILLEKTHTSVINCVQTEKFLRK